MTKVDAPSRPAPVRPRRPVVVWVLGGFALVLFLLGMGGGSFIGKLSNVQKNDNSAFLPSSADSTKVSNASEKFNSLETIPGFVVYQRAGGLTAADRAWIAARVRDFAKIKGVAGSQVEPPRFSTNGTVAAVEVPLIGKNNGKSVQGPQLVNAEQAVVRIARAHAPPGLAVHSAGPAGVLAAFIDAFKGLDGTLLLAAGAVVIVILLFVYRSPVLWFFPLFSAGLALGAAALVIYPLAKNGLITLNGQTQGILSVLVIGAGTDYALLLISRYREELHDYDHRLDAMIAAWRGAAPPIAASGVTVMLGLLCLTIADLNSTASLGPVCAIGIACTLLIMLTVLPALLVLCGRWIFWPRKPRVDHHTEISDTHPMWSRFAARITDRRRVSWIGAAVVMIACAIAIIGLRTTGLSNTQAFSNKPDAVVGQHIYDRSFPTATGAGAPADILVNAAKAPQVMAKVRSIDGVAKARNAVCVELDYAKAAQVAKTNPVELAGLSTKCPAALGLAVTPKNGKTLVGAVLAEPYDSPKAYQTVDHIRATVSRIPGADALVGGSSAINLDIHRASAHDRNLIIPIVLLVILLVLGLVLRALIAPLILILTVVLSFTAALGVSALFFNHVFHFANADPSFPLFAFVFLVALGIDYNIFLMTRVREETLQHGTRPGIVRGLAVTGGVISSAGVVLAATFAVLSVLPIVFLAEIGFTVALGVLLDTIVVRSILVPALSYDIGKKIWWPSRLARAGARD